MARKSEADEFTLSSDRAWKDDPAHKMRLEYVNQIKGEYYSCDGFKRYKKRCETTKHLINQLWEGGKKSTKFGFRLGMTRAIYDNYRDALHDLFDLDEWVYLTPLQENPASRGHVSQLQDFINNLLRSIGYKKMWYRRCDYLPDYGWSPAIGDFRYAEGYRLKPTGPAAAAGGIPFKPTWDTLLSKPISRTIHPYAWFGHKESAEDFPYQGYIRRWYLADVYQAMKKVTKDGAPVYNPEALQRLAKVMEARQNKRDSNYPEGTGQDTVASELRYDDKGRQMAYVDVTYFRGSFQGCKGHYDDPRVYIFEGTQELVLRFAEDPLGQFVDEITHAKTHGYRSSPWSRSFLDGTKEHQRISDLLLNLAIENQVDALHRFWFLNEDDLLDPNDFYNPRGLNTFLIAGRENAQPPRIVETGRSAALADLDSLKKILDMDRQLVGASDQEIGLESQRGNSTATEQQILKSAGSKKLRAACKRISEEAMLPEIKYLTLQALLYYTPDQLRVTGRDGQVIQLTDEHMAAFLNNTEFRVNDHVTRDSDSEALKTYNFWMSAMKITQQLAQPDYAVKIVRAYGRKLGIEELDDILPEPAVPEIGPGGMPGMPGAPGMPADLAGLAPPAPASPQAGFTQPQQGNFNVVAP